MLGLCRCDNAGNRLRARLLRRRFANLLQREKRNKTACSKGPRPDHSKKRTIGLLFTGACDACGSSCLDKGLESQLAGDGAVI